MTDTKKPSNVIGINKQPMTIYDNIFKVEDPQELIEIYVPEIQIDREDVIYLKEKAIENGGVSLVDIIDKLVF